MQFANELPIDVDSNVAPKEMVVGDVDGDGDLDIIATRGFTAVNRVLINDGTGVFTDSGERLSSDASDLSAGDFDGDLDAFTISLDQDTGTYETVFTNDGTGLFFGPEQAFDVPAYELNGYLGDFNGDGALYAIIDTTVWLKILRLRSTSTTQL